MSSKKHHKQHHNPQIQHGGLRPVQMQTLWQATTTPMDKPHHLLPHLRASRDGNKTDFREVGRGAGAGSIRCRGGTQAPLCYTSHVPLSSRGTHFAANRLRRWYVALPHAFSRQDTAMFQTNDARCGGRGPRGRGGGGKYLLTTFQPAPYFVRHPHVLYFQLPARKT